MHVGIYLSRRSLIAPELPTFREGCQGFFREGLFEANDWRSWLDYKFRRYFEAFKRVQRNPYFIMCTRAQRSACIECVCFMFVSLWGRLLGRSRYVLLLINCTVFPNMCIWSHWGEYIREICQLREMIDNQQAAAIISPRILNYFYHFAAIFFINAIRIESRVVRIIADSTNIAFTGWKS